MPRAPDLSSEVARGFWSAAAERRFALPQCAGCGRLRWYLQPVCPRCYTAAWQWRTLSGRGLVYTFTVVHRAFDPGFGGEVPYISALVVPDEDQDVRFVTRLIGIDTGEARVGMSVKVQFVEEGDVRMPLFGPAEPS
jgi:uncharacterized protein